MRLQAKNTIMGFEYDTAPEYPAAMHKIRELREALKMSQAALAERAGTSQPQIRRLENGDRKLTKEWAERLAPHLQTTAQDLLFSDSPDEEREVIGLAVIGTVKAGDWLDISIMDENRETEIIHVAKDPRFPRAQQYALRVVGDSMNELFRDGSFVTVVNFADTGLPIRPGMIVHVEQHMGAMTLVETTLKEIGPDSKTLLPRSTNPAHKPIKLFGNDATEVVVRGIVTGEWKPFVF